MAKNNNDNIIYVSGSEEARQSNEQRSNEMHQRKVWFVLVLMIVLVVTAVCVFVFIKMSRAKQSQDVTRSLTSFGMTM